MGLFALFYCASQIVPQILHSEAERRAEEMGLRLQAFSGGRRALTTAGGFCHVQFKVSHSQEHEAPKPWLFLAAYGFCGFEVVRCEAVKLSCHVH